MHKKKYIVIILFTLRFTSLSLHSEDAKCTAKSICQYKEEKEAQKVTEFLKENGIKVLHIYKSQNPELFVFPEQYNLAAEILKLPTETEETLNLAAKDHNFIMLTGWVGFGVELPTGKVSGEPLKKVFLEKLNKLLDNNISCKIIFNVVYYIMIPPEPEETQKAIEILKKNNISRGIEEPKSYESGTIFIDTYKDESK